MRIIGHFSCILFLLFFTWVGIRYIDDMGLSWRVLESQGLYHGWTPMMVHGGGGGGLEKMSCSNMKLLLHQCAFIKKYLHTKSHDFFLIYHFFLLIVLKNVKKLNKSLIYFLHWNVYNIYTLFYHSKCVCLGCQGSFLIVVKHKILNRREYGQYGTTKHFVCKIWCQNDVIQGWYSQGKSVGICTFHPMSGNLIGMSGNFSVLSGNRFLAFLNMFIF